MINSSHIVTCLIYTGSKLQQLKLNTGFLDERSLFLIVAYCFFLDNFKNTDIQFTTIYHRLWSFQGTS